MNKITIKTNAVFLATVLIVGTIALSSPSFMMEEAQAVPEYGKKANISYDKCINVNLNLNELSIGGGNGDDDNNNGPPGLLANSFGGGDGPNKNNGPQKGFKSFDKDGFVFVCINNNDNSGHQGAEDGEEPPTCETCFTNILTDAELTRLIADFSPEVEVDSLQDICNFIDANVQTEEGRAEISSILTSSFGNAEVGKIDLVLDCLEKVYGVEFPRPD